jgi:hypothetical protein
MCPAKFCYRLFGRGAQSGCTPPVYAQASLSSTFFPKSVAHHNICTCPVSGHSQHSEKIDEQPCSDCNSNPQSQRLNKLSAIDHSDTDRRKKCSCTIVCTDTEPGYAKWSIKQQLVAGQCTERHATQFLLHRRPLEVRHLWITWSSHSFQTFSSPGVFLLVSLTHVNSFHLSLLPLGSLRYALYSTIVSSHQTLCLFSICKTMVCSFPSTGHGTYRKENVNPKVCAIRLLLSRRLKYSWFSVLLRPLATW